MESQGWNPRIIDALAERLPNALVSEKAETMSPRLVYLIVYGQNINAGTTNLSGAVRTAKQIMKDNQSVPIAFVGSRIQALSKQALIQEPIIDFGITNEGAYALWNTLSLDTLDTQSLSNIKGIVCRDEVGAVSVREAINTYDK